MCIQTGKVFIFLTARGFLVLFLWLDIIIFFMGSLRCYSKSDVLKETAEAVIGARGGELLTG